LIQVVSWSGDVPHEYLPLILMVDLKWATWEMGCSHKLRVSGNLLRRFSSVDLLQLSAIHSIALLSWFLNYICKFLISLFYRFIWF
jgi:hypothetical protein